MPRQDRACPAKSPSVELLSALYTGQLCDSIHTPSLHMPIANLTTCSRPLPPNPQPCLCVVVHRVGVGEQPAFTTHSYEAGAGAGVLPLALQPGTQ